MLFGPVVARALDLRLTTSYPPAALPPRSTPIHAAAHRAT